MSDIVELVGELTAVRGQRDALMVEIERLREALLDSREAVEDWRRWRRRWRDAIAEIERLRYLLQEQVSCQGQEIERLRGLLREAGGPMSYGRWSTDFRREVREALGDE
jgi:chromosome segregation ATPase